jgi:hypothetical protein
MKIGGVAQIAECLLCSSKALSLKPSPTKKKKEKKKKGWCIPMKKIRKILASIKN